MKRTTKRRLSICLSLTLVLSLLYTASPVNPAKVAKAADYGLSNPRIDSDGVTTWDCIYFGNYWQSDTNGDDIVDKYDAKQPIKWRVLSVDGDDAFLLADQNLDCQQYNEKSADVTWETCTLRQWLNDDFYQNAFDSSDQSAIQTTTVVNDDNPKYGTKGGNSTSDKVYLLSISEASNTDYGFHGTYNKNSKTREAKNTEYAIDCEAYTASNDSNASNDWWLRSPGRYLGNAGAAYVDKVGFVSVDGSVVGSYNYAVRPALHLNLNASADATSAQWSKAGTVDSLGNGSNEGMATPTVHPIPVPTGGENHYGLSNPRIDSDGVTTWDCIYFGSYWQKDTNGDGKVDKNDAKKPIKWRVLSVDGDDAFLLADQNLDCQPYNEENTDVTWETCTLRQWLNNDFYQNAFDSSEQSAIRTTDVVNEDNPYFRVEGGNNTNDKVYLLSVSEASNAAYGFCSAYKYSETREAKNTAYTKECGAFTDQGGDGFAGNGCWWLRSPGEKSYSAAEVRQDGWVFDFGSSVTRDLNAVRPALHLNLNASADAISTKWSRVGTVSAQGTATPTATPTPVPTGGENHYGLSNPRIDSDGVATWDCIYFGNYWQNDTNGDGKADKNDEKQPIKWRVLSVDGDDAFLLADQNLDCQVYHKEHRDVTWATCTLHRWLNSDFYQDAFDSSEQSAIRTTNVVNEDNPHYGIKGGNNTSDKVYLLSISEASNTAYGFHGTYYEDSKTREAKNTEYVSEYNWMNDAGDSEEWWLRSPGLGLFLAAYVDDNGFLDDHGYVVDGRTVAVRPALHLDLNASADDISSQWSKAGTVSSSGDGSAEGTETPTVTPTPVPDGGETAAPMPTVTQTPVPTGGETTAPTPTVTPDNGKPATPTATPTPVPPQGEKTVPTPGSSSTAGNKVAVTAPAKGVLKNCKNKTGKKISLSWKKIKDAKGYQIQYADNGKWKKKKSKWTKKTTYTIKKLKKKKTYYIRVRAYKLDGSKKVYGSWSKAKKVKVKK